MFDNYTTNQETPSFKTGLGKSVIDRLNMGRLYTFSLFACAAVLVITAFLSVFKIHMLPEGYQGFGLLMFALCLGLCALAVFITSRSKQKKLYDKVCYCYLGVISAVMFNFAFRAESNAASLLFFWALMMIVGMLPILKVETFSIVWGVELVPAIILAIVRGFGSESIISLVSVSIMSFILSTAVYSDTVKKLNYKISLDNALTQAETDPMTQLLNRRGLERRLDGLWPHCIRQGTCVAVLMLDIDNFKKYNDSFGHAAGDECIKAVTGAMRRSVKRRTDYAARIGGEEFVVFLTGIEPKLAVKWALDLQKSIASLKIPHAETNFNPYVSVSMGLSCCIVKEGITFETMREEADKSLYEAKNNGKNCLYFRGHQFGGKQSVLKRKVASNE